MNTQCQRDLQAAGKPYPRTCAICGLGPCKRHLPLHLNIPQPTNSMTNTEQEALIAERDSWRKCAARLKRAAEYITNNGYAELPLSSEYKTDARYTWPKRMANCKDQLEAALAEYTRCAEGVATSGGWNEIKFADDDLPRRDGKDILLGWLIKGCFSTSVVHWDSCCEEWQRSDDDSYVDSLYYATHWKEIDPPATATTTN